MRTPLAATLALLRFRIKRLLAVLPIVVFAAACNDAHITQPDPQIGAFARAGIGAGPEESQRLRGLGGRVFAVHVEQLSPPGDDFDNCYFFLADGSWDDPGFPVLGSWTQHSVGAATTYTANAEFEVPNNIALTLVQEGTVTPALGGGILQLEAYTTVEVAFAGQLPFEVLFLSRGEEVDECPFAL